MAVSMLPAPINAEYLLSANTAEAQSRLVADVQSGRLDPTNLAPFVAERLFQLIQNPPPLVIPPPGPNLPPKFVSQDNLKPILVSQLQKVCPVGAVNNLYGLQYTFRSIHALGKLDWIVGTSNDSRVILSISVMQGRGKLPAMLPIVPSNSSKDVTPSVEMGCSTGNDRLQAEREKREACETLGGSYCDPRRR